MQNDNKQDSSEIKDLQTILFNQMRRLDDPTCDLEKEIKRSNALMNVGTVIVNSAKTQVEFMKVMKQKTKELPGAPVSEPKQVGDGK